MKYRTRTYYTATQKALMWERWKEGWTLHEIGKLFDRPNTSIHGILSKTGGIRPPERRRCAVSLTLEEQEEISRALMVGQSMRSIDVRLGRAPSTISREIARNGGQHGYRATLADEAAWERALRPKLCKLAKNRALARIVADMLRMLWSPEQIAGWLQHTYPNDQSHALIKHARKLPQELYKSLTWDRGTEMHRHKRFTMATDIKVYFCDPQSPWQRVSNENTNGLLRQYLPKGINISGYSQAKLNSIARQLNDRPRKTLGFQTPAERFSECVAMTG